MSKLVQTLNGWGWLQAITRHQWRFVAAIWGIVIILAIVAALGGCGKARSSVPPAAKASARATASQVISGIKTGQAAKQAEGIVQDCFKRYSGTGLIRCVLPYAHHRKLFDKCAITAIGSDIPGQEIKFVQTDLPNCLVAAR